MLKSHSIFSFFIQILKLSIVEKNHLLVLSVIEYKRYLEQNQAYQSLSKYPILNQSTNMMIH